MKNKLFISTLVLLATTLSLSSFAETKRRTRTSVEAVEDRDVAADTSASRFGVGFATFGTGGGAPGLGQALSFWIDFNARNSLQPFFGVGSSDPFNFGAGGIYRHTLVGNLNGGFHLGGGFNLGTMAGGTSTTAFFCNIFPLVGMHFNLGGAANNIALSFDGGMNFHVTPSPFAFTALPLSGLLGASIHYFFP